MPDIRFYWCAHNMGDSSVLRIEATEQGRHMGDAMKAIYTRP